MSTIKKLMMTTPAGGELLAIEDVFSTYLYDGNGVSRTIVNNIDLATEGGMIWFKQRDSTGDPVIFDTNLGGDRFRNTNYSYTDVVIGSDSVVFNADGFSFANTNLDNQRWNANGRTYVSWTFRKAPRFFDVVTYTGNGSGSGQTISHNLGHDVGFMVVKKTTAAGNWAAYHQSLPDDTGLYLNTTGASFSYNGLIRSTTSTAFTIGNDTDVNASGQTYVAYLFAHDPLGPSGNGSDGLIACGSYTGNGSSNGPEIDLGWEPQWVLVKGATSGAAYDWKVMDNMRAFQTDGASELYPNANYTDAFVPYFSLLSNGFKPITSALSANRSGETYIYVAIRRGPMRAPESGTDVFKPISTTTNMVIGNSYNFGFSVDLFMGRGVGTAGNGGAITPRITSKTLFTTSTGAELSSSYFGFDSSSSVKTIATFDNDTDTYQYYGFRRAPGFFDVVAYKGTGSPRWVNHNLTVTPEMVITKSRVEAYSWAVYHKDAAASGDVAENSWMFLNQSQAVSNASGSDYWNSTAPTDTQFRVGTDNTTNRGAGDPPYIAYLFATLPGVSKVGSYTGNGTSQTIDCGFTSGARYILIKRTDSTGDWYVWDTARGIVAGNDPHLSLNTTAAEVTSDDTIDPDSSGFIVNQVSATNVNVSSASYIFYAIA